MYDTTTALTIIRDAVDRGWDNPDATAILDHLDNPTWPSRCTHGDECWVADYDTEDGVDIDVWKLRAVARDAKVWDDPFYGLVPNEEDDR